MLSILSDTCVLAIAYLLYTQVPYFRHILSDSLVDFLGVLAFGFLLSAVISYGYEKFYRKKFYRSNSYKAFAFAVAKLKALFGRKKAEKNISPEYRYAFYLLLVKIFYIPLMLQFTVSNFTHLQNQFSNEGWAVFNMNGNFLHYFNYRLYPILLTICFFIDTVFYLFGYLIYSKALNNTIRTVETTFLGWAVALMCYPPFNYLTTQIVPAMYQEYPETNDAFGTFALRLPMLLLIAIYTLATINLGWKCSNLTNRGIVRHGVYGVVRHPAYIAKNLFWWLSLAPLFFIKPIAILFMAGWTFIYFLRAMTEERHLKKDPDYIDYCKQVKYRFIPKLF